MSSFALLSSSRSSTSMDVVSSSVTVTLGMELTVETNADIVIAAEDVNFDKRKFMTYAHLDRMDC